MGDHLLILCVHQTNETTILVEIGAVIDQILVLAVIEVLIRQSVKPIVFNALKLGFAVP